MTIGIWPQRKLNQVTKLPAELGKCTELAHLHCGKNQLASLPAELGQCAALGDLQCNDNRLTSLPEELGKCPKLCILYCVGNVRVDWWLTEELKLEPGSYPTIESLQSLSAQKSAWRVKPAPRGL